MEIKSKLEEKKISANCVIKTYITGDEKSYILEIDYLQGKFVSEKRFSNDLRGIASMEEVKNLYRSEHDIQAYFGII